MVLMNGAFAPTSVEEVSDIPGSVSQTLTAPSGTLQGMRSVQLTDSFTEFDGDLNGDRKFKWIDRRGTSSRLGESLGTENYQPRADLNLVRVIDAADIALDNSLHCPADVDDGTGTGTQDGGVQIDDLLYYLDIFAAGGIEADVDDGSGTGVADGGIAIGDLLFFLERFELGCEPIKPFLSHGGDRDLLLPSIIPVIPRQDVGEDMAAHPLGVPVEKDGVRAVGMAFDGDSLRGAVVEGTNAGHV